LHTAMNHHLAIMTTKIGSIIGETGMPESPLLDVEIYKMLSLMTVSTCSLPTLDSQRRYVEIMEQIHQIEAELRYIPREWERAIYELKANIFRFTNEETNAIVKKLRNARGSSVEAACKTAR
ncbi:hypothetical protein PFISCL1PPCAC_25791, partial [Pristionchus fissidentatus]